MSTLESRLRLMERSTRIDAPLLLYVPDGEPTPEQQALMVEARQAGRPVLLVNDLDAAI